MATKKLEVLITGNAKGAQRAFGDLERSAGKSGKKTESALSGIAGHLADIGVAAAAFGAFSAWDESQRVAKQTEAVIASTGGAANVTAESISELAGELSKKAGVDDEAIQSGQNLLLTFTKVRNEVGKGNDIFNQATEAALDMSVAMGTDMKSASMLVGKALNDPLKGMKALTRSGVQFTEQQKEQITTMVEAGSTLGAQKVILEELETQFGGSAEAQATSLGKAKVAVGNLAESIGGVLAPAMERGAELATAAADAFGGLSEGAQQGIVAGAGLAYAAARWGPALLDAAGSAKHAGETIFAFGQLTAEAIRTRPEGVSRLAASFDVVSAAAPNATSKVSGLVNAMGGIGVVAPTLAAGVGLAVAAFMRMEARTQRATNNIEALQRSIEGGLDPMEAFGRQWAKTIAGVEGGFELDISQSELIAGLKELGLSVEEASALMLGSQEDFDAWADSVVNNGEVVSTAGGLAAAQLQKLRNQSNEAQSEQKMLDVVTKQLNLSTEENAEVTGESTGTLDRWGKSMADARTEAERATDALKEYYDQQTRGLSAQIRAEGALDDYTQSLKDNGKSTDINTEAGRANQSALVDYAQAAADAAAETKRQTGSTQAAANTMQGYALRLIQTMRQAGYTEDEIKVMLHTMGMTPEQIATQFRTNAPQAASDTQGFLNKVWAIPESKILEVIPFTQEASSALDRLQSKVNRMRLNIMEIKLGERAKGGPVSAGQPYLVGEEGPELIVPNAAGTVMTAKQTRQILANGANGTMVGSGGGGVTVQVYVAGSIRSDHEVAQVVRDELIDIGRRTGRPVLAGYA